MSVESLAAVILIVATLGLFAAWTAMQRHPGRWRRFFFPSYWLRAMKWTFMLLVAAGFGSLIAGGREVLALAIIAATVMLVLEAAMWTHAKSFGERENDTDT